MNNRTYSENLILIGCLAGTAFVLPFTIYRFLSGDYFVSTIEASLVTVMAGIFYYVWRTGQIAGPALLLTAMSLIGVIVVVHLLGPVAVYWYYPVAIACYCIINERIACIFNIIGITLLFPALYPVMPLSEMMIVFSSIIMLCLFGYAFVLNIKNHQFKLTQLAARDSLTGAWNRRSLDESLIQKIGNKKRNNHQASLLILDLDHFKRINDTYGHAVGDEILKKVADLIRSSIRITDKFYRYGGEEFVVVADSTDLKAASVLAESLRSRVETSTIFHKQKITISLGIASLDQADTAEAWLGLADGALYKAKHQGRNRVCMAEAA